MDLGDKTASIASVPATGDRKELLFESEIATLMYAFGDDEQPAY
jgi:hypothetical protein